MSLGLELAWTWLLLLELLGLSIGVLEVLGLLVLGILGLGCVYLLLASCMGLGFVSLGSMRRDLRTHGLSIS